MAWSRINTRMPDDLKRAVERESARLGQSQSDFIREAIVAYVAWHSALDAIDAGHSVEDLRDAELIARLLGR